MLKLKTASNTGSDTLTRDPTRPGQNRWPGDPVTRDSETRFHLCLRFSPLNIESFITIKLNALTLLYGRTVPFFCGRGGDQLYSVRFRQFRVSLHHSATPSSFQSHVTPQGGADLRFLSPQPDTSLHCETTDTGLMHCAVCLFIPQLSLVLTGSHCAYPWRDGQAEFTRVASYIPIWIARLRTVTHPSTNRSQCKVTSFIWHFTQLNCCGSWPTGFLLVPYNGFCYYRFRTVGYKQVQKVLWTQKGVRATAVTVGHCTHAELTSGRALASCYSCCTHSRGLC